jgi:hypothetical protein
LRHPRRSQGGCGKGASTQRRWPGDVARDVASP